MRLPFVAGNWKMNLTVAAARQLVYSMSVKLRETKDVEKVLCPPFSALLAVYALLEGSDIGLGAQNIHWEDNGPFTGEISPEMVSEFCQYVIVGHSERRNYFGETNEIVNRKIHSAIRHDLIPIVCVGESLDQHMLGLAAEVVSRQIQECLRGVNIDYAKSLILAYEPIWAIGNGKAANGADVNKMIAEVIRPELGDLFGGQAAQAIRVLYGGSVTAANASEFFGQPEIDGALVGGASLKADEFVAITQAASRT